MTEPQHALDARILEYYGTGAEQRRLTGRSAGGSIEHERVRRLVGARLAPGSRVLDVGGGTGVHSRWLAADGHAVTLVDPVPAQVEIASAIEGVTAVVGDARSLAADDGSVDAVLLFGPLYHLDSRRDRDLALAEARRVLRPGGLVMVQAITRLANFVDEAIHAGADALGPGHLDVLRDGQWHDLSEGFPGGHLHTVAEFREEVAGAGFAQIEVHGVEGPNLGALEGVPADGDVLDAALALVEACERSLVRAGRDGDRLAGYSPHLMAIAVRPES